MARARENRVTFPWGSLRCSCLPCRARAEKRFISACEDLWMLEITIDDLTAHSIGEIAARLPPMTSGVNEAALNEQFRLIREALQRPVSFERRKYGRIPLPLLLRVTPLDQTGQREDELTMTVVGK